MAGNLFICLTLSYLLANIRKLQTPKKHFLSVKCFLCFGIFYDSKALLKSIFVFVVQGIHDNQGNSYS
jgi:hypothetical protein